MNKGCHPCSTAAALRERFLPPGNHSEHWHPLRNLPHALVPSLPFSLYQSQLEALAKDMESRRPPRPAGDVVLSFPPLLSISSFLSLFLCHLSPVFRFMCQNRPGLPPIWLKTPEQLGSVQFRKPQFSLSSVDLFCFIEYLRSCL